MAGPNIKRLYFSASEVCRIVGVAPGTLRVWETKFPNLKPARSQTGRRLYKPSDLLFVKRIKRLKDIGYTDDKVGEMLFLAHESEAPTIRPEPAPVPVPGSLPVLLPAPVVIPKFAPEIFSALKQDLKEILDLLGEGTDVSGQNTDGQDRPVESNEKDLLR